MTRKEALEMKLRKYNTGKSCKRGHNGWRYTNTGACIQCIAMYSNYRASGLKLNQFEISVMVSSPEHAYMIREFARVLNSAN